LKTQKGSTAQQQPYCLLDTNSALFFAHQQIPLPAPHDAPAYRMASFAANHTGKHIGLRFCGSSG
jgi:hypothetical protein